MYYKIGQNILPSNNIIQEYFLLLSMFNDTLMTVTGYWV
jgi:hypothetical protein